MNIIAENSRRLMMRLFCPISKIERTSGGISIMIFSPLSRVFAKSLCSICASGLFLIFQMRGLTKVNGYIYRLFKIMSWIIVGHIRPTWVRSCRGGTIMRISCR